MLSGCRPRCWSAFGRGMGGSRAHRRPTPPVHAGCVWASRNDRITTGNRSALRAGPPLRGAVAASRDWVSVASRPRLRRSPPKPGLVAFVARPSGTPAFAGVGYRVGVTRHAGAAVRSASGGAGVAYASPSTPLREQHCLAVSSCARGGGGAPGGGPFGGFCWSSLRFLERKL